MSAAIDYDALAGKPGPASKVLGYIGDRFAALWIDKDGIKWTPISMADLRRDTKLSTRQIKYALQRFKRERMLQARMAYFKSNRVQHFAPMGYFLMQLIAFQGDKSVTLEPAEPAKTPIQGDKSVHTYAGACAGAGLDIKDIKKDKKVRKKEKSCVRSHATGGQEDGMKSSGKTVAEVLAESKGSSVDVASPSKPLPIATVWRNALIAKKAGFVPALTHKEVGQLKHFEKTCPPGSAVAVLQHAVANWHSFTQEAKTKVGAFGLPEQPVIGFLVKNLGVAVNFWLDAQETQATTAKMLAKMTAKPEPQPVQLTAIAPTALKPESIMGQKKMTKAELFAALDE
jgi:hypothetical protein